MYKSCLVICTFQCNERAYLRTSHMRYDMIIISRDESKLQISSYFMNPKYRSFKAEVSEAETMGSQIGISL
jgi:hypothetical protein